MVILDKSNGKPLTVLDTKWKRLSDSGNALSDSVCKNASQSDIYQALAYQREYGAAWAAPPYPGAKNFAVPLTSQNGNRAQVRLLNLRETEETAKAIEKLRDSSSIG